MTRAEELDAVVRLACLIEDRTNAEQRALLEVARKTDDELNKAHFQAQRSPERKAPRTPYPSDLEALVDGTRYLEEKDGQRHIALKPRRRRPWVDP